MRYVSHGTPVRSDGSQAYTAQVRAAIVTEVGQDGTAGLMIINPTGLFFHPLSQGGVPHDHDEFAPGTWHWPETGWGSPGASVLTLDGKRAASSENASGDVTFGGENGGSR